jgi:hypothetical protein
MAAPGRTQSSLRHWFGCSFLAFFLYVIFCTALAVITFLRPLPTYDRFLYAGAVASLRYSDPVTLHRIARAEFDAEPSRFDFASVSAEPYFLDVYNNPYHFVQQLGLSRIKFGYVAAGYVLWRGGLPILVSLRLISACCLFVVGLTVLAWTHEALLCSLLLLTPPCLNMGRMVTADPLSTTILVLSLFFLSKERTLLATALLLGSIVVRADNLVLVLILVAWMLWSRRLRTPLAVLYAAVAIAISVFINSAVGMFGYRVLMQHSFIQPEIEPLTHPVPITFTGYLHALAGLRAIPYTFMTVWLLVAAVLWRRFPKGSFFRELFAVIGIYIVVRLLMFPNFDDRVFVWAYLIAGAALIQTARSALAKPELSSH